MDEPTSTENVTPDADETRQVGHDRPFEVQAFERVFGCLARHYQSYLGAACEPYGLSSSQASLLLFLADGNDEVNQNRIARNMGVDKGTVSRNVRALADRGLISQTPCAHDSRACIIAMTDAGHQLIESIGRISARWADTITAGLTEKQRIRMLESLGEMATKAELLSETAIVENVQYAS